MTKPQRQEETHWRRGLDKAGLGLLLIPSLLSSEGRANHVEERGLG